MPPRQEGPALTGGLGTGLQSFSPAFMAITSVTVEKLQRLVPSFEDACARPEGVLRRPPSCLDAPRTLATEDVIGINSDSLHLCQKSYLFCMAQAKFDNGCGTLQNVAGDRVPLDHLLAGDSDLLDNDA